MLIGRILAGVMFGISAAGIVEIARFAFVR